MAARHFRQGARQLGIELVEKVARSVEEARTILSVRPGEVDGILTPDLPILDIQKQRIPTMFPGGTFWTERGGLISYGPCVGRQRATCGTPRR